MEEEDDITKIIEQLSEDSNTGFSLSPGVFINEWDVSHYSDGIDYTYGLHPEEKTPGVYTSHEQRLQHDKYPALQKLWEDYISMYNMTQGEPPIVD